MRTLKANEIEVRVGMCKEKGASLLLYKNARVDMQLMDETHGTLNWKREHLIINDNNYCRVSVYNPDTKEWVSKEDCGTESMTEKQKGEASDSFKRACVNWGIGRELYTSPFVWVTNIKTYEVKGKWKTNDKFEVKEIDYNEDREICTLVIVNQKGEEVFIKRTPLATNFLQNLQITAKEQGYTSEKAKKLIKDIYNKNSSKELTIDEARTLVKFMKHSPIKGDK